MKDLAKRAADSVRNGEMRFVPKRYEKQYFNWLEIDKNIRDDILIKAWFVSFSKRN